jgi:2-dehydro-3-deoxygluconokinase
MTPESLPADYIAGARFFHMSAIGQAISESARAAGDAAIAIARKGGARVSYDTNLRLRLWDLDTARTKINATVPLCNVLLPSLDDSQQLTGLQDADAIADFYLGLGAPLVALKMGAEGSLIATKGERYRVAPYKVTAVDATGAGDTFDGAFLTRLLAGDDPVTAARYANVAAAISTTGYGAVTPIPRMEAVLAALRPA